MRTITSDRLLLRPWRDDDADFLLDLESRWEVVRFLGAHPTTMSTREDALASIARRRAIDDPIHGIWAITAAADGRLVGNLLLKPIPLSAGEPSGGPNDVEIGWHLHPDAWGHGYATEGARAALDYGFDTVGLDEIVSFAALINRRSRAVMERLGMREDKAAAFEHPSVPEGSPLREHCLYRLSRERWAELRAKLL